MPKKHSVLVDELKIKDGGIYCFLPFSMVDKYHKAVFKIGIAKRFQHRSEQYHTYFPRGVYFVAFLEEPRIPIKTRSQKPVSIDKQYKEIERFIMLYLKEHGAFQITSTARILRKNENNEGETEWVYTDENLIHQAFKEAKKKYGGILNIYYLEGNDANGKFTSINDVYKKELKSNKNYYVGQILYPTHRDQVIQSFL